MKRFMLASTALVAATTLAHAGGVERSTQSVAILFEQGRYAELSFGRFAPDVSGTVGGGAVSSGDMAGDYNSWSLGYKMDIGDRMALAFILDQPIGANVNYPASAAPYPLAGSTATLSSSAITAHAPAASAIRACSASTTSMMTPPFSMAARPLLVRKVASSRMSP